MERDREGFREFWPDGFLFCWGGLLYVEDLVLELSFLLY